VGNEGALRSVRRASFRNIVAHGSVAITRKGNGTNQIDGIMNVIPKDRNGLAELVFLEEIKGLVN